MDARCRIMGHSFGTGTELIRVVTLNAVLLRMPEVRTTQHHIYGGQVISHSQLSEDMLSYSLRSASSEETGSVQAIGHRCVLSAAHPILHLTLKMLSSGIRHDVVW